MGNSGRVLLLVTSVGALGACSGGNVVFGNASGTSSSSGTSSHASTSTGSQGSSGQGGGVATTSTSVGSGGATTVSSGVGGATTVSSGVGGATVASTSSGAAGATSTSNSGSTSSGTGPCTVTDPNVDMDGDGWSPADGDCNDCDPTVNPGAVDVPGDPLQVDHDCDGTYDPPVPCDTGLALDDVDAADGAKTIELCQTTTASAALPQKIWGVIGSQYVRADGTTFAPSVQVGIQSIWGSSVNPQGGSNMLALSSGHARTTNQTDACGSDSCLENADGTAPPGFPQDIASCTPAPNINDDVGLEIDVRTPTNATGYSFDFRFFSMEFPYWVCQPYTDQFVALISPPPIGAMNGNILFDSMGIPVSPSVGFFDSCDPTQGSQFASACIAAAMGTCPAPPNPYCPAGAGALVGTGFDIWDSAYGNAGATAWLTTQAPVLGGSEITLRFAIWDGGDQNFDSTTLLDDFQWITSGAVTVGTTRTTNPK